MIDDEGKRARRQQHSDIADREDRTRPEAKSRRRQLLGGQRHRAHQHARRRRAEQELSEQKTLRPRRQARGHRAKDGSDQEAQRNRPNAKAIHRRADRNLRGGKGKMIDRGQAGECLRRRAEIRGHQVEADGRDGAQQRRQHVAARQRQQRKDQRAGAGARIIDRNAVHETSLPLEAFEDGVTSNANPRDPLPVVRGERVG